MLGSIPGPQDHDPTRRQPLKGLSHPGAPELKTFNEILENSLRQIGHVMRWLVEKIMSSQATLWEMFLAKSLPTSNLLNYL